MSTVAKTVLFEVSMVLGCCVAAFTVPRSTPIRTFVIICVAALIFGNIMLFAALRKPRDPARKVNYTRLYIAASVSLLYLILSFVWK